jgi:hypothetical protein
MLTDRNLIFEICVRSFVCDLPVMLWCIIPCKIAVGLFPELLSHPSINKAHRGCLCLRSVPKETSTSVGNTGIRISKETSDTDEGLKQDTHMETIELVYAMVRTTPSILILIMLSGWL